MDVVKPMYVFSFDLNAVKDDHVGTLLTHATDPIHAQIFPPSVGEQVLMKDEEDDLYLATVDRIEGTWIGVTVSWDEWISPIDVEEFRFAGPSVIATRSDGELIPTASSGV